jgi:hypothetical protein
MKYPIKSIFEQISEQVFKMTQLPEVKKFILEFVKKKNINEKDKDAIIKAVNEAKTLAAFQRYICNSLLKYEGLGINQMQKTAREAAAETQFE